MTDTAVAITQLESISTHHILYQYIMHQTDVCYDVACMCFDQYLLLIRRRLNVLVAGEPINLTRLLEMRSQTTSWPLPSNMKKVLLGMATFLRKNIHHTNKMLYNNQLWYSRR